MDFQVMQLYHLVNSSMALLQNANNNSRQNIICAMTYFSIDQSKWPDN